MSVNLESTTHNFAEILKPLGFGKFEVDIVELFGSDKNQILLLKREFDPRDPYKTIKEIIAEMKNSDSVNALIEKHKKEIAKLEKEIDEMVQYKNHYQLQYKIQHGKMP